MSAPIPLRQDFEASQLRGLAKRPREAKMALKPGGFWHLRRSMTVRRAPRRPRSAVSGFKSSGTGCCRENDTQPS